LRKSQSTMAKYTGDIGKAVKDLLYKYDFDNKASISTKTAAGVDVSGSAVKKMDVLGMELKGGYKINKILSAEAVMTEKGKAKLVSKAKFDDLIPGVKATLTGSVPDISAGKLELDSIKGNVGMKATVGIGASPKVDASACYNGGSWALGGDASYDSAKGAVTKYGLAGTYGERLILNDVHVRSAPHAAPV